LLIAVSLYSFLSSNSLAIAYEQIYIDVCESSKVSVEFPS